MKAMDCNSLFAKQEDQIQREDNVMDQRHVAEVMGSKHLIIKRRTRHNEYRRIPYFVFNEACAAFIVLCPDS